MRDNLMNAGLLVDGQLKELGDMKYLLSPQASDASVQCWMRRLCIWGTHV